MDKYLAETNILDYRHPRLVKLIEARQWENLPEYDRIGAVYDFVQNEIAFGYNVMDDIPASRVLRDGYGQCNTKVTEGRNLWLSLCSCPQQHCPQLG